ncbi:MAG: hypothetical protein EP315_09295 [Gammaproteobacteria bacterium]|nr:MAG: hypothetical protein EP315_09295 [Gammaproteobacteria bacterium]
MRLLPLLVPVLLLSACSTTVKGPITKRVYDVNVGCTEDMKRYHEERQQVVDEAKDKPQESFECPPVEDKKE